MTQYLEGQDLLYMQKSYCNFYQDRIYESQSDMKFVSSLILDLYYHGTGVTMETKLRSILLCAPNLYQHRTKDRYETELGI